MDMEELKGKLNGRDIHHKQNKSCHPMESILVAIIVSSSSSSSLSLTYSPLLTIIFIIKTTTNHTR